MQVKKRYLSLDVFRGAAVCLMILVNNPGSWSHIFAPLEHAAWHGLTPTDLVYPFFLFAVGNAMAFVMPRTIAQGSATFWRKVLWRSFLIFMIGLFLNWTPFFRWTDSGLEFIPWVTDEYRGVRILGVLQRIALAYLFASILVFYFSTKTLLRIAGGILILYGGIVYLGNPADPYSIEGFIGNDLDRLILGIPHMYKGEGVPFDPEGILSTLPTISQVLFGYLVGKAITGQDQSRPMFLTTRLFVWAVGFLIIGYVWGLVFPVNKKILTSTVVLVTPGLGTAISGRDQSRPMFLTSRLFVWAVGFLIIGYVWGLAFPVNKKIWTSTFVLVTTGLATALISYLIYWIEIKGKSGAVTKFFEVFGKNPLFIFALSGFLPEVASLIRLGDGVNPWNFLYQRVLIHVPGPPEIGSHLYAVCVIILMWVIAWWMDKKKIYVKV